MTGKLDQTLHFHTSALALRAERQQMLASNIANADTPNFKARDIDFAGALNQALAGRASDARLLRTSTRHMPGTIEGALPAQQIVYRSARQVSVDGNTVDLDVERAQFANNAVHYEANLTFLGMQIKSLLSAIQG
jgi:flagellar basal-body rod protein FlgB